MVLLEGPFAIATLEHVGDLSDEEASRLGILTIVEVGRLAVLNRRCFARDLLEQGRVVGSQDSVSARLSLLR